MRRIPRSEHQEPTFKIVVKSPYIVQACKDVIKAWPGVSWNADPLEVRQDIFLVLIGVDGDKKSYAVGARDVSYLL